MSKEQKEEELNILNLTYIHLTYIIYIIHANIKKKKKNKIHTTIQIKTNFIIHIMHVSILIHGTYQLN